MRLKYDISLWPEEDINININKSNVMNYKLKG